MKTIALSVLSAIAASILSHAQEMWTITETSGPLNIPANAIVQIVGVVAQSQPSNTSGATYIPGKMTQTFADGTKVITSLVAPPGSGLVGSIFSGVSSISVQVGTYGSTTLPVAVTVKITSQTSEAVSPPMVLPVDDSIFSVSLETSTDMQEWVSAFPGDYLGSSNRRFFRVKAIQKPIATGGAPAGPVK